MRVVVSQVSFEHLTLPKEGPSTVSVVLLSNEEGSAPLASAELAGSSDVVLSVTATLPSLDGGLQLQVRLPGGEEGPVPLCTTDLIALGVGAPGVSEGRLLKVPLELAAAPPDAAAAKAPPPAKGKKGAAAPAAAEAAPAAGCSFSCFWRVEPDFMDVSLQRCHPLAVKYFGSAFRDEARGRQMLWREDLRGERGEDNPGLGATRRYELSAPLKPSYLIGDPTSRAARFGYVFDKTQLSITLGAQTVQVGLARLMEQLFACVTAEQASAVLLEMKRFLNQGANLMQIDAQEALDKLSKLFLPFERLVRNVWTEGPEVAYDRYKASLRALLETELETREREAAWAAASKGGFGPKPLVPQLVHDARVADPRVGAPPTKALKPRYLAPASSGTRFGLLAFKGAPPAPTKSVMGRSMMGNSVAGLSHAPSLPASQSASRVASKPGSVCGSSKAGSKVSSREPRSPVRD